MPYVEFDVASMPNLAAYGIAVPTMVLVMSTLRHRDRIPLAVLALLGVFSVHITGGVVTVLFVVAWWLLDALWRPVRGRLADFLTWLVMAVPTVVADPAAAVHRRAAAGRDHRRARVPDAPEGKKRGPVRRASSSTPATSTTSRSSGPDRAGGHRRAHPALTSGSGGRWRCGCCWSCQSCTRRRPFGGPLGALAGKFSDLFYSDPRRLSAVIDAAAGAAGRDRAVLLVAGAAVRGGRRLTATIPAARRTAIWYGGDRAVLVASAGGASGSWHYLPRHAFLFGEKYDSVIDRPARTSRRWPISPPCRVRATP